MSKKKQCVFERNNRLLLAPELGEKIMHKNGRGKNS
jgi:hypothetical protein